MVALPEDPTSCEGLTRASMVSIGANWAAYQRDSLTVEEREAWDARIKGLGGEIVTQELQSESLRPGRMMPRTQTITYYVVPELPEDAA